jgi:hypothetical protein
MTVKHRESKRVLVKKQDKQLQGVLLESVMEKRRLDQALNAKEFAVCAGVSYSTALNWFRLPGFPLFQGVVFWQDFAQWRAVQHGLNNPLPPQHSADATDINQDLPPRAARILHEASNIERRGNMPK